MIVFGSIARKLKTPYPIILVIGGLVLGFVPGMPKVPLDPDIVFLCFHRLLLYGAAWNNLMAMISVHNLISIAFSGDRLGRIHGCRCRLGVPFGFARI